MKHNRLDGLSDGVFAIVMTLLIIEIKVPEIATHSSNLELWNTLRHLAPLFASYVLSFALLFTYWKAHHFFTSVYAKNIDAKLLNINAIFLLLIALVPFSSSLLGTFSQNEIAIIIFSTHIILIGLCLYWMRNYVLYSKQIKNPEITDREIHGSTIRTILPVLFSLIAIPLCFISKEFALTILTIAVIFNLFSSSTKIIDKLFNKGF
jgi:uncharacterized membrane protein